VSGVAVATTPSGTTPSGTDGTDGRDGVRRWRFGVGILALAVVAALLVGFAVGVLTLRPDPAPADDSAEAGFARDMITHHDQAVTMGMIAYENASLADVRQLGYDLAMTQQGQIGMMHQWLRDWHLPPTGSEPRMAWMQEDIDPALIRDGGLMPGLATPAQLTELQEAEGADVDRLFLELMTYHHLGGIHMIDGVLERSDHPEVTWLADLMKSGQEKEMEVMRDLQAELG
jgi:uncharacterized protein (DUF305 family)